MLEQNLGLIIIACTSANKKHTVCDIASAMSTAAEKELWSHHMAQEAACSQEAQHQWILGRS